MSAFKKKQATEDEENERRRPWRDNIEAVTMAIVMAVMLKYFVVEAYKIPTGSMQPTLMGNKALNLEDRILVDKLSFHFRDPERFEVAIFKYPLDRSKNFIKRIVGTGPEQLMIRDGDLFTAPFPENPVGPGEDATNDADAEWTIVRKPKNVQEQMWKALLSEDPRKTTWKANSAAKSKWKVKPFEIEARGEGGVRYPDTGSVVDYYRDGYPEKLAKAMGSRPRRSDGGRNNVGDLRVRGEVKALAGASEVVVEITEGDLSYRMSLPGPAAKDDARAEIEALQPTDAANGTNGGRIELEPVFAYSEKPFRLREGKSIEFSAENLDNRLTLRADGEVLVQLDVVPVRGSSHVDLSVFGEGENVGADFDELQVDRDNYYTTDNAKRTSWDIPEGHYIVLGDNTQDSSDAREWTLARYEVTEDSIGEEIPDGDSRVLRGNYRAANENPHVVSGGPGGTQIWFRDEWGELYHWPNEKGEKLQPEAAAMVPRELITGRALLVFWPMRRDLGIYRLKWIQ